MVAYFIRRVVGGFAQLMMAFFIMFSIITELPEVFRQTEGWICRFPGTGTVSVGFIQFLQKSYHIDNKPWPLNYVYWLFDPEDTTTFPYDLSGRPQPQQPKGVNIFIGDLQIKGSGVLTGDLGISVNVDQGTPVADMYGPGIDVLFAAMMALILILMLIAALQRWRRPSPPALPQGPPAYRLADIYQHQIALMSARPASYSP